MEVKPYKVKEVMHLPGKKLSGKYSSQKTKIVRLDFKIYAICYLKNTHLKYQHIEKIEVQTIREQANATLK